MYMIKIYDFLTNQKGYRLKSFIWIIMPSKTKIFSNYEHKLFVSMSLPTSETTWFPGLSEVQNGLKWQFSDVLCSEVY